LKYPQYKRPNPRYYGADKYKTEEELLQFIEDAGREFYRILDDGGCLWLKWNEGRIKLSKVLLKLEGWKTMLKIPARIAGRQGHQTYWIMLMKS